MSTLTQDQLRAAWCTHQGLAAPTGTDPVATITRHGWPRTLGGASAYVSLLARQGTVDGARVDAAVDAGELWVLPAARGCIYLVPAADVPVALRWGWLTAKKRHDRDVERAGTSWAELEDVAGAVLAALHEHEWSTQQLRRALPDGTVRSLGAAGKKVGMSSTLPLSLRLLESRGLIRRVLAAGRLDKESYAWRVLPRSPFEGVTLADDLSALAAPFMGRFMAQTGPATRRELADWAGATQRDAKAALETLGAVPIDVEGADPKDPFMVLPDHLDGLAQATVAEWNLLPFLDPYTDYRNRMAWIAQPRHHDRELRVGGARTKPIAQLKTTWQRVVLRRGCLAGHWEFDPTSDRIVLGLYDAPAAGDTDQLQALVGGVRTVLVDDLGHGRAFSLDNDKSMLGRVETVRQLPHVLG